MCEFLLLGGCNRLHYTRIILGFFIRLDDVTGLFSPAYFILRQGFLGFYHYCGFVYFRIQPVTFLLMIMYEWCGDQFRSAMLILPTLLL
jgi:hypothetical protein